MKIFKEIEKKGIYHAVCVGMGTIKGSSSSTHVKDYYIIIHSEDKINGFYERWGNLLIHTMNRNEIIEFKSRIKDYKKVVHTEDGRVYEFIDKPFRERYRKWENNTSLMS